MRSLLGIVVVAVGLVVIGAAPWFAVSLALVLIGLVEGERFGLSRE